MSLDALAPDQRAVVQLVLQQERSYEDLAALLGITADAVRERAHNGLERLAPTEGVSDDERAAVADYLLGQQSVSRREATRSLLATSSTARAWAQAVSAELAEVARSPLPEVPTDDAARIVVPAEDEADIGPFIPDEPAEDRPVIPDPVTTEAPTRARPRPRRATVPDYGFDEPVEVIEPSAVDDAAGARTSRLGGALLIAGLGIFVAALIVWLVTRDDEDTGTQTGASNTPAATSTPNASATPSYQPIGQVILRSPTGEAAKGRVIVYAANTGDVAFNIRATKVPETAEGEAYGVWLTGGDRPHFLGFAPPVGDNGRLAVSGPRDSDAANFARWLSDAQQIVVSTETQEGAEEPGAPIVLEGDVRPEAAPTP